MWCAYCIVVMAIYWIFECVPLAITSLIPVVLLPLTGTVQVQILPIVQSTVPLAAKKCVLQCTVCVSKSDEGSRFKNSQKTFLFLLKIY